MKFYKKIVPYLIWGSTTAFYTNPVVAQDAPASTPDAVPTEQITTNIPNPNFASEYDITQSRLVARAENTRDMYMDNMLAAQKRLNPQIGTRNYRSAVRQELPGAPVGLHCMYGQYTQLMRALNETGDTLTVIPKNGKSACSAFKTSMRAKYNTPEYAGTIKEGRALVSDSAYNAELLKYLKRCGITDSAYSKRRDNAIAEFAKRNFSLEHVNPGSIMIVPSFPGSKSKFHAIMFLGKGHIEFGDFAPDKNGNYMFTAHNRERIGDLVKNWDMSNVFCADIEKILEIEYKKELNRLESMSRDKMLAYVSNGSTLSMPDLQNLQQDSLIRLVQAKYFGDDVKTLYTSLKAQQFVQQLGAEKLLQLRNMLTH